jgi:phosphoribosylglycinamide formyltransferase-1
VEGLIDVAVLVSGSGTNLQALIDASRADRDFGARIVLVVSDRPDAGALDRAEAAGIPTQVASWTGDRDDFTARVCDLVEAYGAEAMVLAGFMRILGPEAMQRFPQRIINIHPSLLPAFPGAHAVDQALDHGVKVTGVTVHFVDEQVDHGPIIVQAPVDVLVDDTNETLHARIQDVEHVVFPEAVRALAHGRLAVRERKVVWS